MAIGAQGVPLPSGQTVSSAFDLSGSTKTAFVVETDSLGTATSVLLEFASQTASGMWVPYYREDGSGLRWTVCSGTGRMEGVVWNPPVPVGRIVLGASQSAAYSFTIIPLPRIR